MPRSVWIHRVMVCASAVLFLAGCRGTRADETAGPTPAGSTPARTDTPRIPPTDLPALDPRGPHLLADRMLLDPDGSGIRMVEFPEGYGLGKYSPDGEWRILYSGGYSGDIYTGGCIDCEKWTDMSLWLLHVPDGKIRKVADVTTYAILAEHHNGGECGLPVAELVYAKWSPDGRYLAFLADPDGSTLDLFSYDTDQSILRRLTNPGTADVIDISWSPDGGTIYYVSGAGRDAGAYASFSLNSQGPEEDPDQGIRTLAAGGEKMGILWMDGENIIYRTTRDDACGSGRSKAELFRLDLNTGSSNEIWPPSQLTEVNVDPADRRILLGVRDSVATSRAQKKFYVVGFDGRDIAAVEESLARCDYWGDPARAFLCLSEGKDKIYGITPAGKVLEMDGTPSGVQSLKVAPDRNWFVVVHSQGVDLYSRDGKLASRWTQAERIGDYLWPPGGDGFYFTVESMRLYYWAFSNAEPALIFTCPDSTACFGNVLLWVE